MEKSKNTLEIVSMDQRKAFVRAIERGLDLREAAKEAKLDFGGTANLLDLLNDSGLQALVSQSIHKDIVTRGKELAWKVAQEIMKNPKTPAATRWSAARWTLEASGEGIGSTRENKSKNNKELHEMTPEELQRFISNAREIVAHTAIDVTPSPADDVSSFLD